MKYMGCINFRNFTWNYVNVVLTMQLFELCRRRISNSPGCWSQLSGVKVSSICSPPKMNRGRTVWPLSLSSISFFIGCGWGWGWGWGRGFSNPILNSQVWTTHFPVRFRLHVCIYIKGRPQCLGKNHFKKRGELPKRQIIIFFSFWIYFSKLLLSSIQIFDFSWAR